MLANLPAAYLANYQAAAVIMGLTPTILASMGPSVAETSLLSAHRPLLSFLISLGAPAVYPTRVFEFTDPYSVLRHKEHVLRLPLLGTRSAIICSVLEYVFALAAAASIISTSAQLGAKTILVWACTNQAMPLIWTFLSAAIHIGAALGYKIALNSSDRRRNHGYQSTKPGGSESSARKGTTSDIRPLTQRIPHLRPSKAAPCPQTRRSAQRGRAAQFFCRGWGVLACGSWHPYLLIVGFYLGHRFSQLCFLAIYTRCSRLQADFDGRAYRP